MHAREELGVDPDDLASPMLAAVSSFVAFAVGALIPVLPYLLGATTLCPAWSSRCWRSSPAGRSSPTDHRAWWYGGLRQMLLGAGAAALTYGFGALVGTGLG